MDFFDNLPQDAEPPEDDEPETPQPEWLGPPEDVMGGVVPLGQVLLQTEQVFVGLPAVSAHATGLSLSLVLAVRRGELSRERWQEVQASFWAERHPHRGAPAGDGALRFGVELADGRRVATLDRFSMQPDAVPEPPVLLTHQGQGSGGPRKMDRRMDLWLWPLPEGDSLTLALQWPDLDIPVTTARITLDPVRTAKERETPFWR